MMLKIDNGKCAVVCDGPQVKQIAGVTYQGHPVYICEEELTIGRYLAAYIVADGKPRHFGEIKLTVGRIKDNVFSGKYVLCEY